MRESSSEVRRDPVGGLPWILRVLGSAERRYAFGVAISLVAYLFTDLLLAPLAGATEVFLLLAITVAAAAGGTGPGLLSLAICSAAYLALDREDVPTFWSDEAYGASRVALFVLSGAVDALGVGALRRAWLESRRRRVEAELGGQRTREALDLLRAITESLAEGVVAVDTTGALTFINPAAERMLGWSAAELRGRDFHELVHGPARGGDHATERDECTLLRVIRTGGSVQGQNESFVRKDGTTFPISFTSGAIRERGGRISGAVLAFQDFTEHERSERAERFLAQASEQLATSLDWEETVHRVIRLALPTLGDWCGVAELGSDGKARAVAAQSLDPERWTKARELLDVYPVDLGAPHGIGRVVRTGEPELIPEASPLLVAGGEDAGAATRAEFLSHMGIRSYMAVPLVHRGRTLGALAFGISEGPRRFTEEDLALAVELGKRFAVALENARLYREAREATRAREEVLAIISHDLQTPLGAVRLGIGLLHRLVHRGAREEDLAKTVRTIDRATDRLARLIQDLVDFARMERGRLTVRAQPEDLAAIAQEALELARPIAEEAGIALTLEIPPGLRLAACDRHRVMQVLQNIIGNAMKVVPRGGAVRVTVRPEPDELVISVTDDGPGIPPDDLPRVFERFWRGRRAGYEGTGLGLTIARGIVEAHGGRIWLESEVGRGTTVSFSLPYASRAAAV